MSEGIDETTMEERLKAMMETLPPDHLRYQALRASIEFRAAWIDLAEVVNEIAEGEAFREWGFRSVWMYCDHELDLTRATSQKLLDGYRWIKEEAPEYLPKNQVEADGSPSRTPRPVPELNAASVMAHGYREMEDDRISSETYAKLKSEALQNGSNGRILSRELREAVPEHLRDRPTPNPLKHFKRALKELEKALEQLEEEDLQDDEMAQETARLRDSIFALVSKQEA